MISSATRKKICIHITTYKPSSQEKSMPNMEERANRRNCKANKFVCAICLNARMEDKNDYNKQITKSCPICQKSCDYCQNTYKREKEKFSSEPILDPNVKNVQTSETNVSQGLNLLNEVLTVFQNKRVDITKEKEKPGLFKDVGVSTEDTHKRHPTKLTVSRFQYSIDETKKEENGKFTVVSSCQPDFVRKSQYSIDLIKHKSSSIPQMKLEELKYSLKEKSRSKDAIEEVNRMFATVRKSGRNIENANRPMVRNGPRVLPVVKNLVRQETNNVSVDGTDNCRCCQTCMSSGDSCIKQECCQDMDYERCGSNKCVYMMCCHYQNKKKMQAGVMICDHCKNLKDEYHCEQGCLNGE